MSLTQCHVITQNALRQQRNKLNVTDAVRQFVNDDVGTCFKIIIWNENKTPFQYDDRFVLYTDGLDYFNLYW